MSAWANIANRTSSWAKIWWGSTQLYGKSDLQHLTMSPQPLLLERLLRKLMQFLEKCRVIVNSNSANQQKLNDFVRAAIALYNQGTLLLTTGKAWQMRIDPSRQLVFPSVITANILRLHCVLWCVAFCKVTKSDQQPMSSSPWNTLTWQQGGGRQAGRQLAKQWRSDAEVEPPAMDSWSDRSEKGCSYNGGNPHWETHLNWVSSRGWHGDIPLCPQIKKFRAFWDS